MFYYLIEVNIKPYKIDEFIKNIQTIAPKIRKEKDCMGYKLFSNGEEENVYAVVGEWKTQQAMEAHFQTRNFQVFVGAARVLGETFEMNISKGLETGGVELAKAHISPEKPIQH